MAQTWQDLLFAHWRVDEAALRRVVPAQIPLDTYDGSAWIAVTPFVVTAMRARLALPVPGTARFPEINVRTYATLGGKPGIYFFSLDTPNRLAVQGARRVFRLPYFRSRIETGRDGERIRFDSERVDYDVPGVGIDLEYEPAGRPRRADPGSFEQWAAERYCLYTLDEQQRVLRGDIHHPPWALQPAKVALGRNTMGRQIGVDLEGEPVLHFSRRQDVLFWLNEVDRSGPRGMSSSGR
ncbi:MAG: uncharacterized protein QOJ12_1639 [Thermoleophilales bacterium]|nr:uncharacterized protein [Thermoleophilales bacterium]